MPSVLVLVPVLVLVLFLTLVLVLLPVLALIPVLVLVPLLSPESLSQSETQVDGHPGSSRLTPSQEKTDGGVETSSLSLPFPLSRHSQRSYFVSVVVS